MPRPSSVVVILEILSIYVALASWARGARECTVLAPSNGMRSVLRALAGSSGYTQLYWLHSMQLPNRERAMIAQEKLIDYVLNLRHKRGGSKARLLAQFGSTVDTCTSWRQTSVG